MLSRMSLNHTPFCLKNQDVDPIEMGLVSHRAARNGCTQKRQSRRRAKGRNFLHSSYLEIADADLIQASSTGRGNITSSPGEVTETASVHTIGDKAEQA